MPFNPQVKVTRLYTDSNDKDHIFNQFLEQNQWLQNRDFLIERIYDVPGNPPYKNIIIKCDIATHKVFLQRGTLIFAFSECRIYEYVNILQCAKCSRYCHFTRECVFAPYCRKCGAKHETNTCTETLHVNNLKCSNCISANSRGLNYNNRHKVTDERFSSRIERIEALKLLFRQKN